MISFKLTCELHEIIPQSLLCHPEDTTRSCASGCLGVLLHWLPVEEREPLLDLLLQVVVLLAWPGLPLAPRTTPPRTGQSATAAPPVSGWCSTPPPPSSTRGSLLTTLGQHCLRAPSLGSRVVFMMVGPVFVIAFVFSFTTCSFSVSS